jgi:alkylation response protein AidB-like acyl-CoA dehydrogenase
MINKTIARAKQYTVIGVSPEWLARRPGGGRARSRRKARDGMRFDLSDDQEMLRQTARRFLEKEAPVATIRERGETPEGFARTWWSAASDLGWTSLAVPEALGGYSLSGRRGQDLAVVAEEIGRGIGPGPFQPTAVCLDALARADQPRGGLISDILAGAELVAWAFGEPGNVWTPARFGARARRDGEDWVLEGVKAYVEAGAQADVFLVTARAEGGLVQLTVPAETPGVTVIAGRSLDLVRRFAEVRFSEARVPGVAVLTEAPADAQVERQLQLALLLQCAETNGVVEKAFEFTVDYMRGRYAFGRPIASYQALKHRLADMLVQIHACMATTDAALDAFDAGEADAFRLARIAKAYVATKSVAIMGDLVQMSGGIGVTWDYDLHIFERRVAVNRAVFGAPELHRAAIHQLLAA